MTSPNTTPSSSPAGARLVPDSEEVVELVRRALDVLEYLEAAEQDTDLSDPDVEPWVLPAPLAGSVALAALYRTDEALQAALGSFRDPDSPPGPRMLGPDGRYEHLPLRAVTLAAEDLATLTDALRVINQALSSTTRVAEPNPWQKQRLQDLAELLGDFVPGGYRAHWNGGTNLATSETVRPLARLLAVLDMPPDANTALLLDVLTARAPGEDVRLTDTQNNAYERVATRLNVRFRLHSCVGATLESGC